MSKARRQSNEELEARLAALESKGVDNFILNTWAGYGSSATFIPYFTNIVRQTGGSVVQMVNNSTVGLTFTALKRCKVTMHFSGQPFTQPNGISLNSVNLSSAFNVIPVSERMGQMYISGSDGNSTALASCSIIMEIGDVLRPHTNGNTPVVPLRHGVTFIAEEI